MDGPPASKRARLGDGSALGHLREALLEPMLHYSTMNGLIYADKSREADASRLTQCPVALLPATLPRSAFDEVVAMSPLWNTLVDKASRDLDWLYATLDAATAADPFTKRLVEMCKEVQKEGLRQKAYLGIHRSDYMLHEPEAPAGGEAPRFLQVELNTIASSMGAHASNTAGLHRFLLGRYARESDSTGSALREHFAGAASASQREAESEDWWRRRLPEDPTLERIPDALARAHEHYAAKGAKVLFIVQDAERNFADQRWLEYRLWQRSGVPVLRKTLAEVKREAKLDMASGRLRLGSGEGDEVSVVYFRAGYSPDDYLSEDEWQGRLLLERSLAIKCPSVAYQLVGAKKVQQALARPGAVERFIGDADGRRLRRCFAGLWGLGRGEDDAGIISEVMKAPALYVLKPQREGGGNNFYGEDAAAKLKSMSVEERGAYILMQRILPKPQAGILTREGRAQIAKCISEFGFYSVFLGDGSKEHLSEHAGHLVRTKAEGVDEGGVASGYAVISSPFLV